MLPFIGPTASLPLWSLLARLPFRVARVVWEVILVGALAALVLAALALAGAEVTPARAVAAFVLAATSGPVLSAIALGQAALLGAAATAVAFLALERRSPWAIGAAFLAAIQPNIALPLAVRCGDRRGVALLTAAVFAFFSVTLAVGGVGGLLAYTQRLRLHAEAERYTTIQHSLPAIVASFGVSHASANAVTGAISLVLVAALIVVTVRLRKKPLIAACIAVAVLPLVVPFFHEHDFAIDIFPVLVLLLRGDARLRAIAGVAAVMTLVDWFGLAQRPPATVQIACLTVAVAAAGALAGLRRDERDRRETLAAVAPLIAAALLVACAVPLAHAFAAPTWPDLLGPYRAPPGADIATIWSQESRLAGLDTPVAAWGLLRSIPLAGCVLLAFASVLSASPLYAMKMVPSRTRSATLVSD